MSKNFLGLNSSSRESVSAATKEQREKDQVSALYELGLLSNSDKRPSRRGKDKDREGPGAGARVAGSHPRKGTLQPIHLFLAPLLTSILDQYVKLTRSFILRESQQFLPSTI